MRGTRKAAMRYRPDTDQSEQDRRHTAAWEIVAQTNESH